MNHIKHASELGFLVARAKFAAMHPDLEKVLGLWSRLPKEKQMMLLNSNGGAPAPKSNDQAIFSGKSLDLFDAGFNDMSANESSPGMAHGPATHH